MKFDRLHEGVLNGLSKDLTLNDIANKHKIDLNTLKIELFKGIKVEKEHTKSESMARQIAKDHLVEDPEYYTKLTKANL
jgi:hypothetical protein